MLNTPNKLLVADLFCGAGGSSTGARKALAKLEMDMELVCVNHWPVAIETHKRNHPDARHYCQDITTIRPRDVVPEGYLDLLMASPTCTYYSRARGGKPVTDQQRMQPKQIITWLKELHVHRLLVENVPEFIEWGPTHMVERCDRKTGETYHCEVPDPARKGEKFNEWIREIEGLGYRCEWRVLCAANYGDATTRERFFLIACRDGLPIIWPLSTHRPRLTKPGRLITSEEIGIESLPPWRSAREIIDWSLKGTSIFTRRKPLVHNTLARLISGGNRVGWWEPFLVILRNHMDGRSIDQPLPSITAGGTHIALAEPVLVNMKGCSTATSIEDPTPTITAHARHLGVAEPVIVPYYSSGSGETCTPIGSPLPTITTKARFAMAEPSAVPIILGQQSGAAARSVEDPIPTIATAGSISLTMPVATPFITAYYGNKNGHPRASRSIDQPLATQGTENRFGLVEPIIRPVSMEEYTIALAQGRIIDVDGILHLLDILFRMLQPHELARAMSFSDAEYEYEFVGTKEHITRQIGNAVPVRTASALVAALMSPAANFKKAA